MKILHIINSMIVGGAETLLKDAIIGINRDYPLIEQHLVTLYGGGKQLDYLPQEVLYSDLNVNTFNFIFKSVQLRRYILKHKIDVVHAHLYDSMILSRLALPKNVKLFYTYHNGIYNTSSNDYSKIRNSIDVFSYRKKHTAIFVSETVKRDILLGMNFTGKSYVIPNFTSLEFKKLYLFNDSSELKLISVGNLRQQKNHEHSIRVLANLKDYNISLTIYGSGLLYDSLQALINQTGARVNIVPNCVVNSELLAKYDAFFMSSYQEGMSIALLESMTTGLPAILSRIESFNETAKDSAFYFNINDTQEATEQLLKVFNDKMLLKQLSEKALELSINYSLDVYLKKLIELYSV